MSEFSRNQRVATWAVFLGLGGLGLSASGCGGSSGDRPPEPVRAEAFDLCPPHAFKAVETAPQDKAQAAAATYAEALACFVLDEQDVKGSDKIVSSAINSNGDEEAFVEVSRSAKDSSGQEAGKYLMRVTSPSLDDLNAAAKDPTGLSSETLKSVSISARQDGRGIFSYALSQRADGWHFDASFDKEYHRSYSDMVTRENLHLFEGLSHMATQIACFADHDVPPSQFFPTFVRFNDILAKNCLPRDHVGTPKDLLPVFSDS